MAKSRSRDCDDTDDETVQNESMCDPIWSCVLQDWPEEEDDEEEEESGFMQLMRHWKCYIVAVRRRSKARRRGRARWIPDDDSISVR